MKWVHKWMNELVKFMAKESEWVSVWMWEWARERVNNRLLWWFHFIALVFLVCYLHCLVWLTFGFFSCVVYFRLYFSVSGFLSVPVCVCVSVLRLCLLVSVIGVDLSSLSSSSSVCIIIFSCCARYLINTWIITHTRIPFYSTPLSHSLTYYRCPHPALKVAINALFLYLQLVSCFYVFVYIYLYVNRTHIQKYSKALIRLWYNVNPYRNVVLS